MKFYIIAVLFYLTSFNCNAQNLVETVPLLLGKPTTVQISGQNIRFSISLQNYKSRAVVKIARADTASDLSWQAVRLLLPNIEGYDYDIWSFPLAKKGNPPKMEYVVQLSDIRLSNGAYAFAVPLMQRLSSYYEPKIISIQN
ncbi:hypothetical protein [Dyadobacter luteus]|nr:hypothetical protein [Dyadobacter luteus]